MDRRVLVAAIVAILLLAGCQARQPVKDSGFVVEYRTGSEGLQLNFVDRLPPTRLYDTEDFNGLVEVRNKGAGAVGTAGDRVYLYGFDPRIITGIPSTGVQIPGIEGKTQFNLDGGYDTVGFKGVIRRITGERYPVTLFASACYGYDTQATGNVCVDPDPFSASLRPKVCTPTNVGLGTQGAPVAVTSIEVEPRPQKAAFRIVVQNVGGGTPFRFGGEYLQKCSPYAQFGLEYNEEGYVRLDDVLLGEQSIKATCRPLDNGHVRLDSGRGVVYCEAAVSGTSAYTTPITVKLRYGYRSIISKTFEVVKTP